MPRYTSIVSRLPAAVPFVGPEAIERQRSKPFQLRLGANESAFGISPAAHRAMQRAVEDISWYNDPEGYELRKALANRHGVDLDALCLGSGIDDLLGLVVRMVVEPGTPVVTSLGAYPTFNYHVKGFGGVLHEVPYRDDRIDLDALLDGVRRTGAPLVYLANPDNPMGTWHAADAVASFIAELPEDCVLVLDEAYVEFGPDNIDLPVTPSDPRVIRMRTFSKAHGMAGARIGYAVAHVDIIQALNKIRHHFGINRVAQAGALASLSDTQFMRDVLKAVDAGRADYARLAEELGLRAIPSATNFVALDMGGDCARARETLTRLQQRDVFVRMPGVAPLDRCIRVTVGTNKERHLFATILREVVNELAKDSPRQISV